MAARLARARRGTETRMKALEAASPHYNLALRPDQPFVLRLDGHKFSTFTRHFDKPWDHRLHTAMLHTSADLLKQFHPTAVYTESDEISMVFAPPAEMDSTRMLHMGSVAKILSITAGYCSARFNFHLAQQPVADDEPCASVVRGGTAHFDARAFHVPTPVEVLDNLLWRSYDCKRNSVLLLARTAYTNRQLHKANNAQVIARLASEAHLSWAAMPEFFKYGVLLKKHQFVKLGGDPRLQQAGLPPVQVEVLRGEVVKMNMRYLWQASSNAELTALATMLFAKYCNGHVLEQHWQALNAHWSTATNPLASPEMELEEMLAVNEGS